MSWIRHGTPAIILAPMEGVTDAPMRGILTEVGGFDFCVTEFLRISGQVPPRKIFFRHVPELATQAKTKSGTPVCFQLLGGHPERLVQSALRAVELGAGAIDLNFGCPAPTVNRNDGGATLLKHPDRIEEIVRALRTSVPKSISVSAKLRLGWENPRDLFVNAERAVKGGADFITIHARTRMQGYQPPVKWGLIGELKKQIHVPIVANGDIWSIDDFRKCRDETACEHFMIGRGALMQPGLALAIRSELQQNVRPPLISEKLIPKSDHGSDWIPIFQRFRDISIEFDPTLGNNKHYMPRRMKQWAKFISMQRTVEWYERIKRLETYTEILEALAFNSQAQNRSSEDRFAFRAN